MRRNVLSLLVALVLAGCASDGSEGSQPAAPPSASATATASSTASRAPTAACRTTYPSKVLPPWARVGFSEEEPSVPHVVSDKGDMAAIVWASRGPLASPPSADRSNKILWVARVGAADGPLRITAVRAGTGQTVRRTVEPAPGPSIIDLPAPGCWSFDLTWGRHHDHLQLGYVPS